MFLTIKNTRIIRKSCFEKQRFKFKSKNSQSFRHVPPLYVIIHVLKFQNLAEKSFFFLQRLYVLCAYFFLLYVLNWQCAFIKNMSVRTLAL